MPTLGLFALSRTGGAVYIHLFRISRPCTGQSMFHSINGDEVKACHFLENLGIIITSCSDLLTIY